MRTCILRHGGYPYCSRVAKEVRSLLDAGVEVDLICLSDGRQPFYEEIGRLKVYRLPLRRRRGAISRYFLEYFASFGLMGLLLSVLHTRCGYDSVQVNTMPDFLVFATLLPKMTGARIILDMHEPTPELWMTKFGLKRFRLLLKLQTRIEQWAIRYADQVLVVTESLRRRFAERGADMRKLVVIPNTCDENRFFSSPREAPRPGNVPGFLAVTHGTIEERYGHEVMIRAIHRLKDRIPHLRLTIIGGGGHLRKIETLVKELDCEKQVRFCGYLPFDRLLKTLKGADAGLNTMYRTPYSELIDTNKMYEYIALRIPVITSRLPAIEDNFDGRSMLFFEPGDHLGLSDCILRLHNDPPLRRVLTQNAYERYRTLRWNKTQHRYTRMVIGRAGGQWWAHGARDQAGDGVGPPRGEAIR